MLAPRFNKLKSTKEIIKYNPNSGYIGNHLVEVANYLFTTGRSRRAYRHSKELVRALLQQGADQMLEKSERLTEFLRKRDLTFQKTKRDGSYQIFTVPVTTTVVPLPKSVFNQVETAAQILVVSLRKVLQSIYGANSIEESEFVRALPEKIQKTFLMATKCSPHYLPQLHHPNMKDYPFFDNVGLDLVLVEEYFKKSSDRSWLQWIEEGNQAALPELPFRILELNAGAPSGASNNMNILEGILKEDPETLDALDRVMPNDHFTCLKDTFRSLGQGWTGREDAVQVLLPPGGANGAAPEIHQLAAYSGLIYCDAGQLYCDDAGWIRLRTITGTNPVVNSIYSRINADSALYDPTRGLYLRDPDSGAPLYCVDILKPWKNGKPVVLKDENGKPVPLESDYAIPNAVDAIVNRRLYMGGLNRLLDNKIILATLTEFAPKFFQTELMSMGLNVDTAKICPPECLASEEKSLKIIEQSPEDWVIKAPNLSGGTGVHILMTLDQRRKREVIKAARENPEHYAYQKVVKIARIPVAMRDGKKSRLANLAADIRMWVFYGAGENSAGEKCLPKMTHNALVRYAPVEKGSMSSIVNTSKGGGYAPFVVTDDVESSESVLARDLAQAKEPKPFQSDLPIFVAAQIFQVARILKRLKEEMVYRTPDVYTLLGLLYSLKDQCREITSFIHPRSMESIHSMLDLIEKRTPKKDIAKFYLKMNQNRAILVECVQALEADLPEDFFTVLEGLRVLDQDRVNRGYNQEDRKNDIFYLGHLNFILRGIESKIPVTERKQLRMVRKLKTTLRDMVYLEFPVKPIPQIVVQHLWSLIDQFVDLSESRIRSAGLSTGFARVLASSSVDSKVEYEDCGLSSIHAFSVTQEEWLTGQSLVDLGKVDAHVGAIRSSWMKRLQTLDSSAQLTKTQKEQKIAELRAEHFEQFPQLKEIQDKAKQLSNSSIDAILEILPYLPYAQNQVQRLANRLQPGSDIRDLFTHELKPNHICILNQSQRKKLGLSGQGFAGECFARKRKAHGLLSDSDVYLWVAEEQSALVQAYTIGHELIHWTQIEDLLAMERQAIEDGPEAHAEFLSWYGALFSSSPGVLDGTALSLTYKSRTPLYGLADRMVMLFNFSVIREIRHALIRGRASWEAMLRKNGSTYGYMFPVSSGIKIKAIREILPALENGKNLQFFAECGVESGLDLVRSVLPTANARQISRYENLILSAVASPMMNREALRVIANHQLYGVFFPRQPDVTTSLRVVMEPTTIYPNQGYNQTEQQQ